MSLTIKTRWEIVFLHTHKKGPQLSYADIAKHLKIARSTVKTWVERFLDTGDVQDLEGRGRKRKTTQRDDIRIIRLAENDPETTSKKIHLDMEGKGLEVSESTVRRRLNEGGLRYGPPLKKPLLKPNHLEARLLFALQNADRDWDRVIFTDESTFQLFQSARMVWQPINSRVVQRTVKHPPKVHVWGCFSSKGFGKLALFTRNLDASFLTQIYEEYLLPSAIEMFPEGPDHWVLQEDNDPKHTSKKAKKWREENNVTRMTWPAQSPDLNPIENVWAVMKINVARKKCRDLKGLCKAIRGEWKRLKIEYAQVLVNSMPTRIHEVEKRKGDFILY